MDFVFESLRLETFFRQTDIDDNAENRKKLLERLIVFGGPGTFFQKGSWPPEAKDPDLSAVKDIYSFDSRKLWFNTVFPASDKENWFVSGTAQYWEILKALPPTTEKAVSYLKDQLSELNGRLLYTISREGTIAPLEARQVYDAYNHYRVPLICGTFLLHQLRLYLGNDVFSKIMNTVHNRFKEKPMTNRQLIGLWEKTTGKLLEPFIMKWLERKTLPQISLQSAVEKTEQGWKLNLNIRQKGEPYHFVTCP